MLIVWCVGASFCLSSLALVGNLGFLLPLVVLTNVIALPVIAVRIGRATGDALSPPILIIGAWALRYAVPGALYMLGATDDIQLFASMHLDGGDFTNGYLLATLGLSSLLVGWSFAKPRPIANDATLRSTISSATIPYATLALIAGFGALIVFVGSNANVFAAASTGSFRGSQIQEGTGVYYRVGLALVGAAVVLTAAVVSRRSRLRLSSLWPVLFATGCLWILGGRLKALTALIAGFVILWYVWRQRSGWAPVRVLVGPRRMAMILLLLAVGTIFVIQTGKSYRGAEGIDAPISAAQEVVDIDELRYTFAADVGHLHGVAGASTLKPGSLGGGPFAKNLLWPLSELTDIQGKSVGELIVSSTSKREEFAVDPALAGEAWVCFGGVGVIVVSILFGALLKVMYTRFRSGRIHLAGYAVFLVYAERMYFSSIAKWTEFILIFAVTMTLTEFLGSTPGRRARETVRSDGPALTEA